MNDTRIEAVVDQPLCETQLPRGRGGIANSGARATELKQIELVIEAKLFQLRMILEDRSDAWNIEALEGVDESGLAHDGGACGSRLTAAAARLRRMTYVC